MNKINLMALVLPLFGGLSAYAQGGHVGGGDLCRNEINKHRQALSDWIASGDAADLDFSKAQVKGLDFATYRDRMMEVLAPGKVIVTCYFDPGRIGDAEAQKIAREKGVAFKAITLGDQKLPSACVNFEDTSGVSHIDCNYDSIVNKQSLEDPNYIFTHHEYASIASVELRKTNSEPDFSISNQLSQFEKWIKVKKLGKKNASFGFDSVIEHGLECSSKISANKEILFMWLPDGRYILASGKVKGKRKVIRVIRKGTKTDKNVLSQYGTFELFDNDGKFVISSIDYDLREIPYRWFQPGTKDLGNYSHFLMYGDGEVMPNDKFGSALEFNCKGLDSYDFEKIFKDSRTTIHYQ